MSDTATLNTAAHRAYAEAAPALQATVDYYYNVTRSLYERKTVPELRDLAAKQTGNTSARTKKELVDILVANAVATHPTTQELTALRRAARVEERIAEIAADYAGGVAATDTEHTTAIAQEVARPGFGPERIADMVDRWARDRSTAQWWAYVTEAVTDGEGMDPSAALAVVIGQARNRLVHFASRGNSRSTSATTNLIAAAEAAGTARFLESAERLA